MFSPPHRCLALATLLTCLSCARTELHPAIRLEPVLLDFGAVPVASEAFRSVRIRNLSASTVSIHAATTGAFSVASPDPQAVAPQDAVTVSLRFSPSTTGVHSEDLVVTADGERHSATLRGSGLALPQCDSEVFPTTLTIGAGKSAVCLLNRGTTPCVLRTSDPTIQVSASTLPPNETAVVRGIASRPHPSSDHVLEFDGSSGGNPPPIRVSVRNLDDCLVLRPSTLSFGIVKAGCGALSRSVEVENACSDTNLIAASLSDPFHLDSERLVLGPHEKRTIQVSFDPTRVGTYSGELRLTPSRGGAAAASLRAEAHAEGIQRDHFPRLAADCLIILAPSADLTSKSALREALTHVYSKLSLYDFRLGMVTPDGSGLETLGEEHPYLTSWSEKGVAALAARLEAHAPSDSKHHTLRHLVKALSVPDFFRDSTAALVLLVSDQDDADQIPVSCLLETVDLSRFEVGLLSARDSPRLRAFAAAGGWFDDVSIRWWAQRPFMWECSAPNEWLELSGSPDPTWSGPSGAGDVSFLYLQRNEQPWPDGVDGLRWTFSPSQQSVHVTCIARSAAIDVSYRVCP